MSVRVAPALLAAVVLSTLPMAPARAAESAATDLLAFVPQETVAVVSLRWSEVRASELYRRCEERFLRTRAHHGLEHFVSVTGLDPERDIDNVLVAMRAPSAPSNRERGGAVAIVTGRFDEQRLVRAIVEKGAKLDRQTAGGSSFYRLQEPAGAGPQAAVAFTSPTLALFGDESSVRAALDTAARREPGLGPDSELRRAFERSSQGGQVWGAVAVDSILPGLGAEVGKASAALAALQSLRWVSFDASFAADVALTVVGAATSIEAAEALREAADGLIALARLGAKEDPALLAALAETELTRDTDRVRLKTVLPADLLGREGHSRGESLPSGQRAR